MAFQLGRSERRLRGVHVCFPWVSWCLGSWFFFPKVMSAKNFGVRNLEQTAGDLIVDGFCWMSGFGLLIAWCEVVVVFLKSALWTSWI